MHDKQTSKIESTKGNISVYSGKLTAAALRNFLYGTDFIRIFRALEEISIKPEKDSELTIVTLKSYWDHLEKLFSTTGTQSCFDWSKNFSRISGPPQIHPSNTLSLSDGKIISFAENRWWLIEPPRQKSSYAPRRGR
jgi:hypothetical protein